MAKRKKASKVLRSGTAAKRAKSRVSKAAKATKRPAARAKPRRAPVKKAARKEVRGTKRPVAPAVETVAETVAVEVIEQPAPGVITVTEVEETRKAS